MVDECVTKELCNIKHMTITDSVKNLEIRMFEVLKQTTQISEMAHSGHKEALHSAIKSMQKDFGFGEDRFKRIELELNNTKTTTSTECRTVNKELDELKNSLVDLNLRFVVANSTVDICTNKIKFLSRVTAALFVCIILAILNEGNWTKTYEFLIKLIF